MVLRYGYVYGLGRSSQSEAGAVAIFWEQILRKRTLTNFEDGTKIRDSIHFSKVARVNVNALERGDHEILNIASGKPTTDYEIFCVVRRTLGVGPLESHYAPKRPGEIEHTYLDVNKARAKLDWWPEVELRKGVR